LVCKTCDSEFDFFDVEGELIPEPVFVPIRLSLQYAIIDTRRQAVYAFLDTEEKAELISHLLNRILPKLFWINKFISERIFSNNEKTLG
jgi:hypothetical protein